MAAIEKEILNTDTYQIAETVNNVAKQYIPEMTEDTLAIGLPGLIVSLETKKIKDALIETNTLGNEVFPSRALLDQNVITHAIMQGIDYINSAPARMTVILGLSLTDFEKYATDYGDGIKIFRFDKYCEMLIGGEYPFHLDYDIILRRSKASNGYVYTATYDLPESKLDYNRISNIGNPYIKQPYVTKIADMDFIFLQTVIHQVSIRQEFNTFITSNVVDNKTVVFTFNDDEQLADFEIKIIENNGLGDTVYLYPVLEGSAIPEEVELYCEYVYVNATTIRIKFIRSSYMPKINDQCELVIKTSRGAEGNFKYDKSTFIDYYSETYGYPSGVSLLIRPQTNSTGGINRKSVKELHSILPKEILMNKTITTETDLYNYLNLVNTDDQRLHPMKKADSSVERIYYVYYVSKNSEGNIVPTNTIRLQINQEQLSVKTNYGCIMPAGSAITYSERSHRGYVVNITSTNNPTYKYLMLYTVYINYDPLYAAFFLTIINEYPYAIYKWINEKSPIQFMVDNFHFERSLLIESNIYNFEFTAIQNINSEQNMYIVNKDYEVGDERRIINNMKCFIVLYLNGEPHRYAECTLDEDDVDFNYFKYTWRCKFITNNEFDTYNRIRINNLYIAGTIRNTSPPYAFFPANVEARVYILATSEALGYEEGSNFRMFENRYDLDNIIVSGNSIPQLEGYTVTNVFDINNGLDFFVDYSGMMNTSVTVSELSNGTQAYVLKGVPVIGYNYVKGIIGIDEDYQIIQDEELGAERFTEFLDALNEKKAYLDNALVLLENSFELDFKFYNSYGPSLTYSLDQEGARRYIEKLDDGTVVNSYEFRHGLGRIDINLGFYVSLRNAADIYTKNNIVAFVKEYVENLNTANENFDANNLITAVRNNFAQQINWIDYIDVNGNELTKGTLHLYYHEPEDKTIPPEFINIRTSLNESNEVVPEINIEVVNP